MDTAAKDRLHLALLDPSLISRFYGGQEDRPERDDAAWRSAPWRLVCHAGKHKHDEQASSAQGHHGESRTWTGEGDASAVASKEKTTHGSDGTGCSEGEKLSPDEGGQQHSHASLFPSESYLDLRVMQNAQFCQACLERGQALLKQTGGNEGDRTQQAEAEYRRGLQMDSHHAELWVALGWLQASQRRDYETALQSLERALAEQPHHHQALLYQHHIQQAQEQQRTDQQQQRPKQHRSQTMLQDVQAELALGGGGGEESEPASSASRSEEEIRKSRHKKKKRDRKKARKRAEHERRHRKKRRRRYKTDDDEEEEYRRRRKRKKQREHHRSDDSHSGSLAAKRKDNSRSDQQEAAVRHSPQSQLKEAVGNGDPKSVQGSDDDVSSLSSEEPAGRRRKRRPRRRSSSSGSSSHSSTVDSLELVRHSRPRKKQKKTQPKAKKEFETE